MIIKRNLSPDPVESAEPVSTLGEALKKIASDKEEDKPVETGEAEGKEETPEEGEFLDDVIKDDSPGADYTATAKKIFGDDSIATNEDELAEEVKTLRKKLSDAEAVASIGTSPVVANINKYLSMSDEDLVKAELDSQVEQGTLTESESKEMYDDINDGGEMKKTAIGIRQALRRQKLQAESKMKEDAARLNGGNIFAVEKPVLDKVVAEMADIYGFKYRDKTKFEALKQSLVRDREKWLKSLLKDPQKQLRLLAFDLHGEKFITNWKNAGKKEVVDDLPGEGTVQPPKGSGRTTKTVDGSTKFANAVANSKAKREAAV